MNDVTALNLISQLTGLISLLILYWASFGVPHDKETWKGASPEEIAIRSRQRLLGLIGIASGVIAIGCQTFLTIWPGPNSN